MEAALAEQGNGREAGWTKSVAVGREDFVRRIGQALGGMARGRTIRKVDAGWQLREAEASYNALFGSQNSRFWRLKKTISVTRALKAQGLLSVSWHTLACTMTTPSPLNDETHHQVGKMKVTAMTISKVIKKYKFNEQPKDFVFWQTRSFEERLEALEQIRKEYNSWRYNAEQGFQRVYRIIKQA